MSTWQSNPIKVDGDVSVDVKADADGVTLGAQSDGSLLVDLHCTPDQARSLACALIEGADKADAAREG